MWVFLRCYFRWDSKISNLIQSCPVIENYRFLVLGGRVSQVFDVILGPADVKKMLIQSGGSIYFRITYKMGQISPPIT